jgi:DnaJ-class molecular chaperone
MANEQPLITECSRCGGHGVEDRMGRNFKFTPCKKCGGCGDLFNGMPFSEWQKRKEEAKQQVTVTHDADGQPRLNGLRIGESRHRNAGMLDRMFAQIAAECDAEDAAQEALCRAAEEVAGRVGV